MTAIRMVAGALCALLLPAALAEGEGDVKSFDVVIVGGTPGGIMAAVAAGRDGRRVVLLERTNHIGGLPANGLGATDIQTRGATQGLFLEFVTRIHSHYVDTYGADSPQTEACSEGYHFEPSVAEGVFEALIGELGDTITVLRRRQFDAIPERVTLEGKRLTGIRVLNRDTGELEEYTGKVFLDATYEGDLAAAAGAPYRLGREGASEFNEPMAGRLYKPWGGEPAEGSTGLGDNAVQAYNYRLCLTKNEAERVPIAKPATYNRAEYASLVDDIVNNHWPSGPKRYEKEFDNIGRVVNMVILPNGKTDSNNQHASFLATDLPEENWPWPTSDWDWRDRYAERLRDYTLGLIWFVQHDPELPEDYRQRCLEWGLARSEYTDNGNFPRAVYVREGRRIEGRYLFTAHDALSKRGDPAHVTSITASHYALDSHPVRKREPGRAHLDGMFSYGTKPYAVPFGVMVPKNVEGLLTPVPVSGTHIGFSTLRMEPCWMAMGQAAGTAASLSIEAGVPVDEVDVPTLQHRLLAQGAVLMYFKDAAPGDAHYEALQFFGLRGYLGNDWEARLDDPVSGETAKRWMAWTGVDAVDGYKAGTTTRGALLDALYARVSEMPRADAEAIVGRVAAGEK